MFSTALTYQQLYYEQVLDHFRFSFPVATFKQKYLLSDEFFGFGTEPRM